MTEKAIFAKNMQTIRRFYGWSQEATARKLNVKRSQFAAYEEARAFPQLPLLVEICKLYKISNVIGFITNPDFNIHADFVPSSIKNRRKKIAELEAMLQMLETKAYKALSILKT